jgi:hypothetical protein
MVSLLYAEYGVEVHYYDPSMFHAYNLRTSLQDSCSIGNTASILIYAIFR